MAADYNDTSLANDALDTKNPSYKNYGKQRVVELEFDLTQALVVGDKIIGPKLPKNCLILGAKLVCPTMGATGIFALGLRSPAGVDTKLLIASADAGGQAVNIQDGIASTDIGTVKADAGNLMLEVLEITVATSGKIQCFVTVAVE